METFGEYLRSQREKKGIRLEEIASITKIHLHTLQYLEHGNWDELPPEPFIRGFIIAYSKYVGLETKDVLERYALEHGKSNPQGFNLELVSSKPDVSSSPSLATANTENTNSPDHVLNNPKTFPVKKIAFIGLGVFTFIFFSVLISVGKKSSEPTPVAKVETPTEANAPATTTPVTEAPATVASAPVVEVKPEVKAAPEFPHEISVETKEKSWGKIVVDNKQPVEFYSEPGKKLTYQGKEKLKLVLGNASGAVVQYNGNTVEGKRFNGTIRYYVFPNGARFPQDVPKRKVAEEEKPSEEPTKPDEKQD